MRDGDGVLPTAAQFGAAEQASTLATSTLRRAWATMIEANLDDRVLTALNQSPYLGRGVLRFETAQGRVTLRGVVPSYFQKQMAQEALRRIDGIDEIANELEVQSVVHGPGDSGRQEQRILRR